MAILGRVHDGKIIPEPGARLTEGSIVRIEPVNGDPSKANGAGSVGSVYHPEDLAVDDDLPADLAEQHDHYIYGARKRER